MPENHDHEIRIAKLEREQAALSARFDAMKTSVDALTKETQEQTGTLRRIVQLLTSTDPQNPGIGVRLIRMEDAEKRRLWWVQRVTGAVITAVVGLVASGVWYLIRHAK